MRRSIEHVVRSFRRRRKILPLMVAMTCLGLLASPGAPAGEPADKAEAGGAAVALPLDKVKPLVEARRFDEAERLAREMLAEAISMHGPDSMACAQALDALVHVQVAVSDPPLEELRRDAERAVAIKRALIKEPTLELATSVNNLGRAYVKARNYEAALASFRENVRIREKIQGPNDIQVGKALNNVALVLNRMGEYAAALPLYDRVMQIFRQSGAPEYPEMATVKTNLGLLLKNMGDYARARTLLEEVLRTQEAALGPTAPPVGGTLGNLASVTFIQGDLAACRRYWERILDLWAKEPESSPYAAAQAQLGNVLLHMGEAAQGRKLIENALGLQEKLGLMQTRETATYLNYEAYALALQKDLAGARSASQRSLDLMQSLLGERHQLVGSHRLDHAEHLYRMGEFSSAFEQALLSERIARNLLVDTFPVLSERQALLSERARTPSLDLALTLLLGASPGDLPADAVGRTWDAIVRSRALVLDEIASRQRESAGPELQPDGPADRLAHARRELSRLLVVGQGSRRLEDYESQIRRAVEAREQAERDLAQFNAAYGNTLAGRRSGWSEVAAAMPESTTLLAYVRFIRVSKGLPPSRDASYAALVLDPDKKAPRVIGLGLAGPIETAIEDWRREAGSDPRSFDTQRRMQAYGRAADRLRALIWDPVWRTGKKPSRVIAVPDGAIHLVSLATLTMPNGKFLVESVPILHYVAAERDIVSPPRAIKGRELVIVGGPDYDSGGTGARAAAEAASPAVPDESPEPAVGVLRSPRKLCASFGTVDFDPLPQSLAEADDVAALWAASGEVRKLTGPRADEASVKAAAPFARVLHLATHSFFMGDQCGKPDAGSDGPGDMLLFSGLALAGANQRTQGGALVEDGILTAEEISSMDLSGTDWVVLSGCETGVGKTLSGQGVLGLRRAFETASSRTLIMSLWQVEDDATRAWMNGLYRHRLDGLSTADSVSRASLDLLDSRRRRGLSTHPFFWGAFVSSGNWR